MLKLTRRPNEKIVLFLNPDDETDTVEITVTEIQGKQARLSFICNPRIKIMRAELLEATAIKQPR